MNVLINRFRHIALAEGLSLILLVCVAMPLKYMLHIRGVVPIVGTLHGLLFLSYLIYSLIVSHRLQWSVAYWLLVMLASIVPGGTFILDRQLKKIAQQYQA